MVPVLASVSLNSVYKIEDFPAPVLPTIPTFIPGSIFIERFLSAGSSPYL